LIPFLIVLELVLVLDAFRARQMQSRRLLRSPVFPVQAVFNQQWSKIEYEFEFEDDGGPGLFIQSLASILAAISVVDAMGA